MWFRTPRRNDSPLLGFAVREDDGNLQSMDQANGVHADLAVVETIIHTLDCRALENLRRVFQMPCNSRLRRFFSSSQI